MINWQLLGQETSAALAGLGLGCGYFGGLWWTVRCAAASPRPALWFALSLLLRTSLVVGGFYLASGGQWQRMTVCLAGFVSARMITLHLARRKRPIIEGPRHAS